jgi:DNA repair exonuclease SbcCD ATPase subunit
MMDDLPGDVERCRQIIAQQREDLQHLKELVVRHEAIIAEYQSAYPELNPHVKVDAAGDGPTPPLPPWMASPQTMVPLLAAYDRRVQLLETSLEFHKQEVQTLKSNSIELVEENETLRSDLKHYMDAAINGERSSGGGASGGSLSYGASMAGGALGDELQALQEQNHVLLQTNQVLTQQTSVLEADLEQSRNDMERLQSQNIELQKRAQYLEHAMRDLDRGRLGEIDATRSSYSKQVESLSHEARNEITKLQRELGHVESEKRILEQTLQDRVAQVTELEARYAAAERKRSHVEQELHTITAKYEETSRTFTSLKSTVTTQSFGDIKRLKQLEIDLDEANRIAADAQRAANVASMRNKALEKELDELRQQQVCVDVCV